VYEALRQVKFATRETPFETGDQITYEDFCGEIPETRKRERIIAQLIDQRRIIAVTENKGEKKCADSGLVYVPVGRFKLPNGEIVRGKEAALKRLEELEA